MEPSESKYLPKKFLHDVYARGDLVAERRMDGWHSKHLQSLNEPSLLTSSITKEETYRFIYLRSFDEPISVRVSSLGDNRTIVIKKTDSKGDYEAGKLVVDTSRSLSPEEWQKFMTLLENSCFWGMRSWDDRMGIDGAAWFLEGVKNGRYHIVARWSPGGGDFQEACKYLLRLSELSPKEIY